MAEVLTFDSAYIAKERKRIKDDVSYARYKVGSTWYQADIQSAEILPDGRVEVTFTIDHTVSGNITVTGIELYDRNGTRMAGRTVSITRAAATEGIQYVCRLSLFQVVPNAAGTGSYDAL